MMKGKYLRERSYKLGLLDVNLPEVAILRT